MVIIFPESIPHLMDRMLCCLIIPRGKDYLIVSAFLASLSFCDLSER